VAAVEGSISYVSAVKYSPAGAPCSLTNDGTIVSTFSFNNRLQPLRMHATYQSDEEEISWPNAWRVEFGGSCFALCVPPKFRLTEEFWATM
jgi:hypothetical protein